MRPTPNLESWPNAGIRANPVLEVSQFQNYCTGFRTIPAFGPLSKFGSGRTYIVTCPRPISGMYRGVEKEFVRLCWEEPSTFTFQPLYMVVTTHLGDLIFTDHAAGLNWRRIGHWSAFIRIIFYERLGPTNLSKLLLWRPFLHHISNRQCDLRKSTHPTTYSLLKTGNFERSEPKKSVA